MTIYILHGSTGEYADRCEWVVCAFADQNTAEAMQGKANTEAEAFFLEYEPNQYALTHEKEVALRQKHLTIDPTAPFDYTGTYYYITECELRGL